MAYYDNVPLINSNGDTYYPQTKTNSVYNDEGTSLQTTLSAIDSKIDTTFSEAGSVTKLTSGEKISTSFGKIAKAISSLITHLADTVSHITSSERSNWNTAYTNNHTHNNKAALDNLQSLLDAKVNTSLIGNTNGIAQLDSSGKIPAAQLPSYVDDILEGTYVSSTVFNNLSSTAYPPETGKIYVDTTTNLQYRWSGASYVIISSSLALGETSSTAYPGDKGKAVTDALTSHSSDTVKHITSTERTNWNNAVSKVNGISAGAEVNQNAFSNVVIGSSTVSADSKTDTLTLVAGTGITLSADTTTDTITINGTAIYTLPTATSSSLGGVKSGTDITVDSSGNVNVIGDSHPHTTATITDFATTVGLKSNLNTVDNSTIVNAVNEINSTSLKAGLGATIGTGVPRNADLLGGESKTYYENLKNIKDDTSSYSYKFVMNNGAVYLEQL